MTLLERTIDAIRVAGFPFVADELEAENPVRWEDVTRMLRWAHKRYPWRRAKIEKALRRVEELTGKN